MLDRVCSRDVHSDIMIGEGWGNSTGEAGTRTGTYDL